MRSLCFNFQIHIPVQFKTYRFFDIGRDHHYYDDFQNKYITRRFSDRSFLPANKMILKMIEDQGFRASYTISGPALRFFEWYATDVLESFQELAKTGNIEFAATPFFHSIIALKDLKDLEEQTKMQMEKIKEFFSQTPKSFVNTDLIYSDGIGEQIAKMGFTSVLTEGAKHILGWKSPDFVYTNPKNEKLALFMRNNLLSDDLTYRFSDSSWEGYPLTADKFAQWLQNTDPKSQCVNVSIDYRVIGDIYGENTGIFEFFEQLPQALKKYTDFEFQTQSTVAKKVKPAGNLHIPTPISWLGYEKDTSAITGNELQRDAIEKIYRLKEKIEQSGNAESQRIWNVLQDSSLFLQMNRKSMNYTTGNSIRNCPYQNYINYMNILTDLELSLKR